MLDFVPPWTRGDFRGLRSRTSRPPYPALLNDGNGFVLVLLIVVVVPLDLFEDENEFNDGGDSRNSQAVSRSFRDFSHSW